MFLTFQQTKIWDGTGNLDETLPEKRIKVKRGKTLVETEVAARRRLPKPELGRRWVLVLVENRG